MSVVYFLFLGKYPIMSSEIIVSMPYLYIMYSKVQSTETYYEKKKNANQTDQFS
jgi:hypothetical protein